MKHKLFLLISIFISTILFTQQAPYVYNVSGTQRTDGSCIVDIYYNVLDPDDDSLYVSLKISDDNGATYEIIPADSLLNGDIGEGILTGNDKHIVWLAGEEATTFEGDTYKYKVIADDLNLPPNYVIDIDGNVYQTLLIGDQEWMAENLKVTHYRNGDPITTDYSNPEWSNTTDGAYCVFDNEPSNADTYGNLYNGYAVDDPRGLAPAGWHVASDEEIMELEMYLGMTYEAAHDNSWRGTNEGSKLAGRAYLWHNGELEVDPEFGSSGFDFLPGGYRGSSNGNFYDMGSDGFFWSTNETNTSNAWWRGLNFNSARVNRGIRNKQYGYSVRCVRD